MLLAPLLQKKVAASCVFNAHSRQRQRSGRAAVQQAELSCHPQLLGCKWLLALDNLLCGT